MKQARQNKPKPTKRKTQLERAAAVLLKLAIDVTPEDRKAAEQELALNRNTIGLYLRGAAADLDIAMTLIRFLKGRIAARDIELAAP